jgi:hypothetical protein
VFVERGFYLRRADASLASLLVTGNLDLRLETALFEAALLMDLNGDGDMLDVHPPSVAGIVWCSGALTLPYSGSLLGSAMGQSVKIVGNGVLADEPLLLTQEGP